jgi:adenosylmethionine-8-amino-7-oxononanoate aminotransferase
VTITEPDVTFLPRRTMLAVDRGEGVELVARDGRRILDAAGGAIVANIGYGRPEVVAAAARSLERIGYVVPPFATPEREALIARLRDRWLPDGLHHVLLVSGGSESIDSAVRIARLHHASAGRPDRSKILSLEPSYHGMTVAAISASGHAKRRAGLGSLLIDWPKVPLQLDPECPALGYDQGDAAAHAAALDEAIERAGPDTVAAFIAEPVGGAASGAATPPPGYWSAVAEVCRRHDVLVIADEVMCGFGRTGSRFAVEAEGVVPDILIGGKGLGGGYAPLGGLYATDRVVDPIVASGLEVMFFTFSSSNVACAVADAVLDIVEREELVAAAAARGEHLARRLHAAFDDHPHVAQVRGRGLLHGVEIVRDRETLTPFPLDRHVAGEVTQAALRRDVWVYPAGSGRPQDCILLGPAFVITEAQIDQAVEVLAAAIDEVATRLS